MKRTLTTLAAGALVVGGGLVATQPAQGATPATYSVMLLQPNISGASSSAKGLNNRGDVVGYSSVGLYHGASFWKARSGAGTRLPGLDYDGTAHDVSGNGSVAGTVPLGALVYYTPDGTSETLDANVMGGRNPMSEGGLLAFHSMREDSKPYIASSAKDVTEMPMPEGARNASVSGISQDGRRVAGSAQHGDVTIPVVWTDLTPTRLQVPSGATEAQLTAVNTGGTAAGCAVIGGAEHPVRYSASGAPTMLPALAGYQNTCATVINDAGVVAGNASNEAGGGTAVVWVNGQARKLDDLVAQRSGYSLYDVADINESGQVVGTAILADGSSRGYIATPSTAETIYTSPGYHNFNGRQWKTTCEPYSKTTRCRTEIWASTVKTANGRHSIANGWAFNNLTYLPSDRTLWKTNPLGNTGTWTATDGRNWRTECDTAATGRNGCRSYSRVTVVEAVPNPAGGYTFRQENKFVFNNIVKFTTK